MGGQAPLAPPNCAYDGDVGIKNNINSVNKYNSEIAITVISILNKQ